MSPGLLFKAKFPPQPPSPSHHNHHRNLENALEQKTSWRIPTAERGPAPTHQRTISEILLELDRFLTLRSQFIINRHMHPHFSPGMAAGATSTAGSSRSGVPGSRARQLAWVENLGFVGQGPWWVYGHGDPAAGGTSISRRTSTPRRRIWISISLRR